MTTRTHAEILADFLATWDANADYENTGWHEGWTRMTKQLLALATR